MIILWLLYDFRRWNWFTYTPTCVWICPPANPVSCSKVVLIMLVRNGFLNKSRGDNYIGTDLLNYLPYTSIITLFNSRRLFMRCLKFLYNCWILFPNNFLLNIINIFYCFNIFYFLYFIYGIKWIKLHFNNNKVNIQIWYYTHHTHLLLVIYIIFLFIYHQHYRQW